MGTKAIYPCRVRTGGLVHLHEHKEVEARIRELLNYHKLRICGRVFFNPKLDDLAYEDVESGLTVRFYAFGCTDPEDFFVFRLVMLLLGANEVIPTGKHTFSEGDKDDPFTTELDLGGKTEVGS